MASKSLGTLTIDLIAKVSGFVGGMDQAERQSKKTRDKIERDLTSLAKKVTGFVAANIAATSLLVKSQIDVADSFSKTAQITGIAIDDLSALAYAGDLSDVSFEQLTTGVTRFSRAIQEAMEGTGAGADAFKILDINVKNADGTLKSTMQLIEEVADRMQGMEDNAIKTAVAQDLLGRSGAMMIPLLNGGSAGLAAMREEAERLGLVLDADTGRAAEEFNDNLTRMKTAVTGTGRELAASLLPNLVEFTDLINDPNNQQAIKDVVKAIAEITLTVVQLGAALVTTSVELAKFFGQSLAAAVGGAAFGDLPRLEDQLADINRQIDRLTDPRRGSLNVNERERLENLREQKAATEELIRLSVELQKPSKPAPVVAPTGSGTTFTLPDPAEITAAEKLAQLADDRIAKLQEEIALRGNVSEVAKLQYEIEYGALKGITAEQEDLLLLLAQQRQSEEWIDSINDAYKTTEEQLRRQLALTEDTSNAARVLYEIEHGALKFLDPARKAVLVDMAAQLDLQALLTEEERKRAAEAEKQTQALQELGLQAARNIQSSFADFLFDPFDDGLKGMLSGFGNTLRRMAAEAASQSILKSVFGGLAGASNPILAGIGGAFAGLFDSGGVIGAGQWGVAGEVGPELVRGPAIVTSRQDTARMLGGAPTVNIHNYTGERVQQRYDPDRNSLDVIIGAVQAGMKDGRLDETLAQYFGVTRARGAT